MMINDQPCRDTATYAKPVLIRALSSITAQQAVTIVQAVQAADDGGWDTQISDDYDGYRHILVERRQPDLRQPCYFVSGTAQRLDLFAARDDQLIPVGCFSHVDELTAKLVSLIAEQ